MSITEKIQQLYYKNLCFQLQGKTLDEYMQYCTEEEEMDQDELEAHLEYKTNNKRVLASSVYWLTTREWRYVKSQEKVLFPPDFQAYMDVLASEREVPMPLDYDLKKEQFEALHKLLQGSDEAAYYASVILHYASEIEASSIDRSVNTGWDHW